MGTTRVDAFVRRLARGMTAQGLAGQTDRQLVERLLAAPDEAAFEALVRRHGPMVYRVGWRVLGHAEDAEDAFQATFLLLARKLPAVRRKDSLAAWLHGVAHRVALDARKRAARRRRHEGRAAAPPPAPLDDAPWRELRAVLDAELAALPEAQRQPLVLCYLQGLSQDEAAGRLGWSKSTLLRRLAGARAALGRRLARRGFAWPAAGGAVLLADVAAPAAPTPQSVRSAVEAAVGSLTGRATAGVPSAAVAALTEGALRTMSPTKLTLAGALLLAALASAGVGLAGLPDPPQPPEANGGPPAQALPPGMAAKPVAAKEDAQVAVVAWSPDGKTVATVCRTWAFKTTRVDPNTNETRSILTPRSAVKLRDARTGAVTTALGEEKDAYIDAVAFAPDGKTLAVSVSRVASAADDGPRGPVVRLVDPGTGKTTREVEIPGAGQIQALSFSPDGKTLAVGGSSLLAEEQWFVKVWDVAAGRVRGGTAFAAEPPPGNAQGTFKLVGGLAFSPDGGTLAVAAAHLRGGKDTVRLFDPQTGEPRAGAADLDPGTLRPDRLLVAFAGGALVTTGEKVKVWDVKTGKLLRTLETRGAVHHLGVSADGKSVMTAGARREKGDAKERMLTEVVVWDATTWGRRQTLPEEKVEVTAASLLPYAVALSPDGTALAVGLGNVSDGNAEGGDKAVGELKVIPLGR